jgi:regulator of extracellular matrix RemA (YlzA/DUF370 family)
MAEENVILIATRPKTVGNRMGAEKRKTDWKLQK